MNSSNQIKKFILDNLSRHRRDIIYAAIQRFGVSRQAVLKHMHTLINDKKVVAHGKTRDRFYELRPQVNYNITIPINNKFSTQLVLSKNILPHIASLPKNLVEIIQFSITALLNNISDHSKATKLYLKLYLTYDDFHMVINDNGKGIFGHISSILNLDSIQCAVLELAKGRVTTDEENHSGDELNTVIHLFDEAVIESNGIFLKYINKTSSFSSGSSLQQKGTRIHLKINPDSKRTCGKTFKKLFDIEHRYTSIPVSILRRNKNEQINSRNQAKTILSNINNIRKIKFDFNNVDLIGPAFADELIRGLNKKEKAIEVQWINSNEMIDIMMSHAVERFS